MLASTRRNITYPDPNRSDSADVPRDFLAVVAALEVDVVYGQGTLAARPISSVGTPGMAGRVYMATDSTPKVLYWDNGTGWDSVGNVGPGTIGTTQLADASVTKVKIAADVPVVPIGATMGWPWSSGSIPAWSALPYGQSVLKTDYPALNTIASVGYPHGSDATHLSLPDERGRVNVGKDDMGGAAANRITVGISGVAGTTLGAVFGSEGVVLTTGQIPAHNHGAGTLAGTINDPANVNGVGDTGPSAANSSRTQSNVVTISGSTANTGGGGTHQNVQPSIIVNKIMRML